MTRKTPEIIQQLHEEEQLGLMQLHEKEDEHDQIDKSSTQSYMNKSNDQTLRTLIKTTDTSNAGILIADNKGIIQYVNDTFAEMTGFSYNELYEKNLKLLLSNNQQESFFNQVLKTVSTGQMWTGELESTKKNNETYWEQVTILPVTDQQGSLSYFLSIKKEITQQKQLEQSLRIKENAILSSINAIVFTDLSGKITYVNPSFLKMWSFDSEKKVIGESVFSLWKKGNQYANIMDNIISNGGWLGELIACSRNGRLFPVQMSANIVKDEHNKPLSIMASFVDITKQKRMEKNYKKFKTISDEADYGTIIYDLTSVILYVNASFARTHGYQIDELIGEKLSILYSSNKNETIDDLLSELKEKGKIVGKEQVHLHKKGTL
ncbi:MAG: PAS domain S-box protein, partial [Candidatus Thermoplasmatota archaeon]|nr:PAS domain S-box protein [Candidatus Thermoplasmatota archaeon]